MEFEYELERMKKLSAIEGTYLIRAVAETGETAAAALFRQAPFVQEEMVLLHLYIRPEYRGRNLTARLLQYAEKCFGELGIRAFRVKCCGNGEKMEYLYDFLVEEGFYPLLVGGRLMHYRLSDWIDSRFAKKIAKVEHCLDAVVSIEEEGNAELQAFLQKNDDLRKRYFDPQYTRFYLQGETVQGAMCARLIGDNLLFLHNLFLAEGCRKEVVFVSMLASLLKDAKYTMPQDAILIIQHDKAVFYQCMCEEFGIPRADYLMHAYYYPFGHREYAFDPSDTAEQEFSFVLEPSAEEGDPDLLYDLPIYEGLDAATALCLQSPQGMVSGRVSKDRRKIDRLTEEQMLEWRKELNTWYLSIGREPLPAEKPLPFAVYRQVGSGQTEQEMVTAEEKISPERITYAVVKKGNKRFASVLPQTLRERYETGEVSIICGRDEKNRVISYGAFSAASVDAAFLEDVFVSETQRRAGHGKTLVAFARETFGKKGVRQFLAKQTGEDEPLQAFLQVVGFELFSGASVAAVYYLQDLCDTAALNMTEEQRARLPKITELSGREEYLLWQLVKNGEKKEEMALLQRNLKYFDPRFSRCYIKDGMVQAVLLMEQTAENVLLFRDMWVAPIQRASYVYAALLISMIEGAKRFLREDGMLFMEFDSRWNMDVIHRVLGYGDVEQQVYIYKMKF